MEASVCLLHVFATGACELFHILCMHAMLTDNNIMANPPATQGSIAPLICSSLVAISVPLFCGIDLFVFLGAYPFKVLYTGHLLLFITFGACRYLIWQCLACSWSLQCWPLVGCLCLFSFLSIAKPRLLLRVHSWAPKLFVPTILLSVSMPPHLARLHYMHTSTIWQCSEHAQWGDDDYRYIDINNCDNHMFCIHADCVQSGQTDTWPNALLPKLMIKCGALSCSLRFCIVPSFG